MGRYGQGWTTVGRSGLVTLIRWGWVTWVVGIWVGLGICAGLGVVVDKFGQIWARVCNGGQVWMGQTDGAGMGDMARGWGWVCIQVKGWV